MRRKQKPPDGVIQAGGREFRLYKYFDKSLGEELLNLPNFQENPEYTAEGRPFALAVQESCEHGRDDNGPNNPDPGDCGGCVWFHREQPAAIGVCMCDALRREQKEEAK